MADRFSSQLSAARLSEFGSVHDSPYRHVDILISAYSSVDHYPVSIQQRHVGCRRRRKGAYGPATRVPEHDVRHGVLLQVFLDRSFGLIDGDTHGDERDLIAVPFVPTYAEYIYLKGRRVLADQMEFLLAHFPRTSPLHERLKDSFGKQIHRK